MRFSIIMPVLNEEASLETYLRLLARPVHGHDCELLIVDGGSTDATINIAERYGRVICSSKGRAKQMNTGACFAQGDIFLFLHADTQLPDDALTAIEYALQTPQVVGGAFRLSFDCKSWLYQLVAFSTNLRSRLRTIFTGDQAYFMRAESFHTVGGYPDIALMEDLEIIKKLRGVGKVVLLPQYIKTSARRHEKIGLLRSVTFMWYMRTLYRFGVSPARLQQMYLDIR